MRLTEQQLYNMICESINNALVEADVPNMDNDTTGTFKPTKIKNAIHGLGKNPLQGVGKRVASKAAAGGLGYAAIQGLSKLTGKAAYGIQQKAQNIGQPEVSNDPYVQLYNDYAETTTPELFNNITNSTPATWILGAVVMGLIAKSVTSWYKAKNKQVPKTYLTGKESIQIAVAGRNEAQQACIQASEKIKKAIETYNSKNSKPISETELFRMAQQGVEIKGRVPVTPQCLNIDFTDKYAQIPGVGNISEANIAPKQNGNVSQEKQALIDAMGEYVKIVTVWLDWTDYINRCVSIFTKAGVTFKNAIDGKAPWILVYYAKKAKQGVTGAVKNAIQGNQEQQKPGYQSRRVRPITVSIVNPKYKIGPKDGAKKDYVLTKPLGSQYNFYFALPSTKQTFTVNAEYKFNYSPSYIASETTATDGLKIYILRYVDDTDLTK